MPDSVLAIDWLKYGLYVLGGALVTVVGIHYRYVLQQTQEAKNETRLLQAELDKERMKEQDRQAKMIEELISLRVLAQSVMDLLNKQ